MSTQARMEAMSTPEGFAAFLKTEDAGIGDLAKKGLLKPE